MPMVFPGMDPWLEDPLLWPDVHDSLIVYLRAQLQPLLRPRYFAALGQRVYVEGPDRHVAPDLWIQRGRRNAAAGQVAAVSEVDAPLVAEIEALEVRESYIEIRDLYGAQDVITVIEVVSPANKHAGPGRQSYRKKQREVLASPAHLVEIDLLR